MSRRVVFENPTTGAIFELIAQAAAYCERCPTGAQITKMVHDRDLDWPYYAPNASGATQWLARKGLIHFEVYGQNWRVAEILVGEHTGKRTKSAPRGSSPYLIVDRRGARRVEV